jgi:arylsulfatase A-like enzyme
MRLLLIVAGLPAGLAIPGPARAQDKARKPNILFIFTDDQSYRTVSCYPRAYPFARTPNIDKLARMGIRFAAAYNGS